MTYLKATKERVFILPTLNGGSTLNPGQGYVDILIPRAGLKNGNKAVTQRVKTSSIEEVAS